MPSTLIGNSVTQIDDSGADNFTKVFAYFSVLSVALVPTNAGKSLQDLLPRTAYRFFPRNSSLSWLLSKQQLYSL